MVAEVERRNGYTHTHTHIHGYIHMPPRLAEQHPQTSRPEQKMEPTKRGECRNGGEELR